MFRNKLAPYFIYKKFLTFLSNRVKLKTHYMFGGLKLDCKNKN